LKYEEFQAAAVDPSLILWPFCKSTSFAVYNMSWLLGIPLSPTSSIHWVYCSEILVKHCNIETLSYSWKHTEHDPPISGYGLWASETSLREFHKCKVLKSGSLLYS
jgi:hypothetical protein